MLCMSLDKVKCRCRLSFPWRRPRDHHDIKLTGLDIWSSDCMLGFEGSLTSDLAKVTFINSGL